MKLLIFSSLMSLFVGASAWGELCRTPGQSVTAIIVLDGSTISSSMDVHAQLANSDYFPEYYGRNLDALFDVLANFDTDLNVYWQSSETSAHRLGDDFQKFVDTFKDGAEANSHSAICLHLL